jgi:hypothetical protein
VPADAELTVPAHHLCGLVEVLRHDDIDWSRFFVWQHHGQQRTLQEHLGVVEVSEMLDCRDLVFWRQQRADSHGDVIAGVE